MMVYDVNNNLSLCHDIDMFKNIDNKRELIKIGRVFETRCTYTLFFYTHRQFVAFFIHSIFYKIFHRLNGKKLFCNYRSKICLFARFC